MDREERAAWGDAQRIQAEKEKRADEIRMAKIQEEAEEKKRAYVIQMAKEEADKELEIKQMDLKAQAQDSADTTSNPPPPNRDAKSLKLPAFVDEKDELDSYLLCYAENGKWEKVTWAIKLSALLTGRAMDVYTRMSDGDANNYDKLKKAL